jgi:hypothetical protein
VVNIANLASEKKLVPIPKGALFTVTTGCYSDYSVCGVFRALAEIDCEALREEWLRKNPEQAGDYKFNESGFLAANAHLMEPLECWDWHLADYATINEMDVNKRD